MIWIAHRINTVEQLRQVPPENGIEVDLRDSRGKLVLWHDPFPPEDAPLFEDFLKHYRHRLIILNVKSERIEVPILDLMQQHQITDYFFLDSSYPMIRHLVQRGEHRIAVRFSEFEPIESALALAGDVEWVWVDCFTKMPLDPAQYQRLRRHFRLCAVSPELQGRPVGTISDYAAELAPYPMDAICTKRPDVWQAVTARPNDVPAAKSA
jgi:hypothetical protein